MFPRPRAPSRAEAAVLAAAVLPTVLGWALRLDLSYAPLRADLSLFLSPWAAPLDAGDALSRVLQLAWLVYALPPLWAVWAGTAAVALLRAPLGFVLTRSVGWAAPALFAHWALYERMGGWGPGLLVWHALAPGPAAGDGGGWGDWGLAAVGALALLERRPWTYAAAGALALALLVLRAACPGLPLPERVLGPVPGSVQPGTVPVPVSDKPRPGPLRTQLAALGLGALALPLAALLRPAAREAFPATTLDIMLLSFPRPGDSDTILRTTVASYAPHLSANVTLSGFTHAPDHAAFRALAAEGLAFHVDEDAHPDDEWGHYLHLAEAFRWAGARAGPGAGARAEWVMLAEDDFPLCAGGWAVLSTVVAQLERERAAGRMRAGFVGTGGSGLVMHRSYLPLLSTVLREYSRSASRLPPGVHRRAPDQVVQDCLRGTPGSLCERRGAQRIIISSRIVMDHIGGMATTTKGKPLNSDKWRCGWRHAWHGAPDVDVVVV